MHSKSKTRFLRICCHIIFIIYFLLLIKIVLFKYRGLLATFDKLITGELDGFRSYNVIPFQSIWEFTKLMFSGHFSRGFNNIIGNIFVFAPFGYFVPLLHKKCQKAKTVVLAGFCVSLIFEICQYFLYLGSADIDDIMLNLLGVILGFLFFKTVKKITYKKQTVRYIATIILSIIGFIVAGYLAVNYFGIMFGISNKRDQVNSSDDLPGDFTDNEQFAVITDDAIDDAGDVTDDKFEGNITSFDDSSITVNKIEVKDLENGASIAVSNEQNPVLQTVYITETTKYTQKDIYDVNGDKVEIREATKEDLEIDKHINIKGYQSDNKFFATEIIINNFLFM